jgi:WD40 repeat protein
MIAAIAVLTAIECLVLRTMGMSYTPRSHVGAATIHEFQLSAAAPWGASRVSYLTNDVSRAIESQVLLHDLRRSGEVAHLDFRRFETLNLAVSPGGDWLAFFCRRSRSIHICRRESEGRSSQELTQPPGATFDFLAWSPDGRLFAASGNGRVYLWRMPEGEFWRQFRHDDEPHWVGFSGDSQLLLSAGTSVSQLWNVQTGVRLKTFSTPNDGAVGTFAFSPSGERIAYLSLPGLARGKLELRVVEVETGDLVWRAEAAGSLDHGIAFSADGALLASVRRTGERGEIVVFDAETGAERRLIERPGEGMAGLEFAADGVLYSWDRGGTILGHDIASGRVVWRFSARQWEDQLKSKTQISQIGVRDRLAGSDYSTKPTVQFARCRKIRG